MLAAPVTTATLVHSSSSGSKVRAVQMAMLSPLTRLVAQRNAETTYWKGFAFRLVYVQRGNVATPKPSFQCLDPPLPNYAVAQDLEWVISLPRHTVILADIPADQFGRLLADHGLHPSQM